MNEFAPHLIDSVTVAIGEVDPVTESNIRRDRAVSQYSPKGTARGGFAYFRFSYKEGNRVRHVHIPGGNARSALAQSRAIEVRAKISAGAKSAEIVKLIAAFGIRSSKCSPSTPNSIVLRAVINF